MTTTVDPNTLQMLSLCYIKTGHECYQKVYDYVVNGYQGDLYLSYTRITSLPEGLTVGGDLDLRNTQITSLPEGLKVGGDLDLYNTPITSLPEGLTVGGSLYLSYTRITSLPEGLKVGGDLYLGNTPISKQYSAEQLKQMLPNVGKIYA